MSLRGGRGYPCERCAITARSGCSLPPAVPRRAPALHGRGRGAAAADQVPQGSRVHVARGQEYLDGPEVPLAHVIGLHLARLKERIALQRRLCDRLEAVATKLGEEVSSENFIETVMEVIEMSERVNRYYTPE